MNAEDAIDENVGTAEEISQGRLSENKKAHYRNRMIQFRKWLSINHPRFNVIDENVELLQELSSNHSV